MKESPDARTAPEPFSARLAIWARRYVRLGSVGFLVLVAVLLALSGPPHKLVIATGPNSSYFAHTAELYAQRLKAQGVTAELVHTQGALDNLQRINAPDSKIDIAFTHGGLTDATASPDLVSLGSVAYEPLWIFYRKPLGTLNTLAQLKGLRVVLGLPGSGANTLSRKLLKAAGLDESNLSISEAGQGHAARQLKAGEADAVFFMDPPETAYIHDMFNAPGVAVMNLVEAEGLRRNLPFLHVLHVPRATIDVVSNQPPQDMDVLATTSVVVARKQVHSALVYLLMSIVDDVHEPPTLLSQENEFPADKDVDLPLSEVADQYFKSGKPFLQRYLPFWLASLLERMLKVMVPLAAVLVPLTNYVPKALQWRSQRKTTRCYVRLMELERRVNAGEEPADDLLTDFGRLAAQVDGYLQDKSIPPSDLYILKEHIELVRNRLRVRASLPDLASA